MSDVLSKGLQGISYPGSVLSIRRKVLDNQLLNLITSITHRTYLDIETCILDPPQILRDFVGPTIDASVLQALRSFKRLFGYCGDEDPLAKEEDLWLKGEYSALDKEEAHNGSNDNTRTRRKLLDRLTILLKKRRQLGSPCKCCRGLNCSNEGGERVPSFLPHAENNSKDNASKSGIKLVCEDAALDATSVEKVSSRNLTKIYSSGKSVRPVEKVSSRNLTKICSSGKSVCEDGVFYSAQASGTKVSPGVNATCGEEVSCGEFCPRPVHEQSHIYPAQVVASGEKVTFREQRETSSQKSILKGSHGYGAKGNVLRDRDSGTKVLSVQTPKDFSWHTDLTTSTCSESIKNNDNELPQWLLPRVNYNDGAEQSYDKNRATQASNKIPHSSRDVPAENKEVEAITKEIYTECGVSPVTKAKSTTEAHEKKCSCQTHVIPQSSELNRPCNGERQIVSELKLKEKRDPSLFTTTNRNFSKYCHYFEKIPPPKPKGARNVSVKQEKISNFGLESKLKSVLGVFNDVNIRLSRKMFNEFDDNKFGYTLSNHAETSPNKATSSSIAHSSSKMNSLKEKNVSKQYDGPRCKNKSCQNVGTSSGNYNAPQQVNQMKQISTHSSLKPGKVFWCSIRLNVIPNELWVDEFVNRRHKNGLPCMKKS